MLSFTKGVLVMGLIISTLQATYMYVNLIGEKLVDFEADFCVTASNIRFCRGKLCFDLSYDQRTGFWTDPKSPISGVLRWLLREPCHCFIVKKTRIRFLTWTDCFLLMVACYMMTLATKGLPILIVCEVCLYLTERRNGEPHKG